VLIYYSLSFSLTSLWLGFPTVALPCPDVSIIDDSEASAVVERPPITSLDMLVVYKEHGPQAVAADADYPSWIWDFDRPQPTLKQLQAADYESLTSQQRKRMGRLLRLKKIAEHNARNKKGAAA
jgi:hypothetical protein